MFKISFDFDEVTKKVTNVKVEQSDKKSLYKASGKAIVEIESNKLKLTTAAVQMIGAKPEERVNVNYWQVNNSETIPLIGKSEVFSSKLDGNKLTKSNTVSFRGTQRQQLLQYGDLFELTEFKPGMFRLIPITDTDDLQVETTTEEGVTFSDVLLTEQEELSLVSSESFDIFDQDGDDDDVLPF